MGSWDTVHICIGWKTFFQRHVFIRIYLVCLEYFYHSLPQKEGEGRDTLLMFCRQDFFELKPQMLTFPGLFAMNGFRYKLHCKPLLCSLSAFHYTGQHWCLFTWDWPSACEICTWSCFRARMSGLNLASEMPVHNLGPREVHTCYPGEVLHIWVSWASPPFIQELADVEPIEHLFFIYFSCLQNFFLPSVPLEPGPAALTDVYPLHISFGRISCTYLATDMTHKKGPARIMWSMRRLFYMTDTPSGTWKQKPLSAH